VDEEELDPAAEVASRATVDVKDVELDGNELPDGSMS
jgi:hypothetical protein